MRNFAIGAEYKTNASRVKGNPLHLLLPSGQVADLAEVLDFAGAAGKAVDAAGRVLLGVVAKELNVAGAEVVSADDGGVVGPGDVGVEDGFLGDLLDNVGGVGVEVEGEED